MRARHPYYCVIICTTLLLFIINLHAPHQIVLVECRPLCGIGNQMFQYAAGLAARNQYPETCVFGAEGVGLDSHPGSSLLRHADVVNMPPLAPCHLRWWGWWRLEYEATMYMGLARRFHPPCYRYVPFDFNSSVVITGYLQSYKYFENLTRPFFRLKQHASAAQWLAERNITSVAHVRRGDMLLDGSPVAPAAYYERALRMLGSPRIAVCTDDPQWVRSQPVFAGATISTGHGAGFDLALMAAATNAIIVGVGTFGWWGAYLSEAKNKVIYRVQARDPQGEYSEADFIPDGWIVLD